jgi:succinyl-diaminopimelate desuccinylase
MERLKKILFDILKIPSVSDNIQALRECIDYLSTIFEGKDLYIQRLEVNSKPSIYVSFVKSLNPKVLFCAHLDVVPPDSERDFEPREEEDRIYARGALDMKGPTASVIDTILDFLKEGKGKNAGFLFTTDEEVGSKDGVNVWVNQKGLKPDFVVIPDGGVDFKIMNQGKGVLHVRFKSKGVSAHGSTPWDGENAADKLISLYNELKKWVDSQKGLKEEPTWKVTLSLGKINSGRACNIVPDYGEMELDFRFPPPWGVESFREKIQEFLDKYKGIEMEIMSYGEPVYTPEDNEYVMMFAEAVKRVKGRVGYGKIYGATDGRFFAEKGIPVVMIYPVGGNIHGKNEWVSYSSLKELKEIFYVFLEKF